MRRVLCISGKRFYGKDTLARAMVVAATRRGLSLETYAFADESKRMFAASHPDVELARLLSDRDYKERWRPQLTDFTVNALAADSLVFVREVMRRIEASSAHPLITDLRLVPELEHLRTAYEPYVLRLARSDLHRATSGWSYDTAKDTHRTETELDDSSLWNEVVPNDGTEAELAERADSLVGRLLG